MIGEKIKTTTRASLLDGATVASEIKLQVKTEIELLSKEQNFVPCLAAVRVGDDPASAVYVRNKIKACEEVGIRSEHYALPESTSTDELLSVINSLNNRPEVSGILTQLPLPKAINEKLIIESINPLKDVDGFHPINVGKLAMGDPLFVPCHPAGIIELLDHYGIELNGIDACVVGRSQIVGRPTAQLLLQRNATVTICHSQTRNLSEVTSRAELLVAAIGRAGMIGRQYIKPGATVIDVGMNRLTTPAEVESMFGAESEKRLEVLSKRGYTLIGDVHPAEAAEVAGRITPVPGGVGLLTVAMLMKNTLKAAKLTLESKTKT